MAQLPDPIPRLTGTEREIYDHLLAKRQSQGTGLYGPYVPFMNHPRLAERIEELGHFYKFGGALPRDIYQFVVLAFARHSGADLEWQDHIEPARKAGVPSDVLATLQAHPLPIAGDGAPGATALPAPYDTVWRAMSAAINHESVLADVQQTIVATLGVPGLLEVVTRCGFYALISIVNRGFDVG